jgi:hypothetical protein
MRANSHVVLGLLLMMLRVALQKPTMIEAWIIDSAASMGKDVEVNFAFDSFNLSLKHEVLMKKVRQPRHEFLILLTFPYEHI